MMLQFGKITLARITRLLALYFLPFVGVVLTISISNNLEDRQGISLWDGIRTITDRLFNDLDFTPQITPDYQLGMLLPDLIFGAILFLQGKDLIESIISKNLKPLIKKRLTDFLVIFSLLIFINLALTQAARVYIIQ